jgi:excisionase family DNA binding protein
MQHDDMQTNDGSPGLDLAPGDLVGYAEAAQLLGTSVNALYGWVYARRVPHIRLGKRTVLFSKAALARWIGARVVAAKGG